MKMLRRRGAKFCVHARELWKIGEVKGEWVGPGYMSWAGSLCGKPGTLVTRNKNHLCDYMTTEPALLAGYPSIMMIPGGNFLGNHACWEARWMAQARNRTAGSTLFMRVASLRAVLWRVVTRQTFASLGLFPWLRSHVLRAYCNFESKQANLITLFGRRPNNNSQDHYHAVCFGLVK